MRFFQGIHRAAGLAIFLAAASPAAYAQQATPGGIATAKELISITGSMNIFQPLIPGVIEQAKLLFLQQDPGLAKDLNEIATKMRQELAPRLNEIDEQVARLYATHFTEAELKEILAFYKSPTGKKMISQQPIVVDTSMKFAQDWATKLSDEVVSKMRAELKKKGHNL
jgi:hypothetical protein